MAEDRLFRVIVLGGMALIGAAPAAGCTPTDAPGEGTLVPQSQTVVLPEATPPAGSGSAAPIVRPPPPREGPPPPRNVVPIDPIDAGAPVDAGSPPPPLDAGSDGGFHLKPPREGPPPRPRLGL